jgi:C1q domain
MPVPITYTNFVPPAIDAGNLNTVNNVVYTVIGDGTNAPANAAAVRTNIGLGTMATQNANAVAITGGTIGNLSLAPPLFSATLSANVTLTNSTFTPIIFDTKDFDTNTFYSTVTGRFTPTIAGYYFVSANLNADNSAANLQEVAISLFKNGVDYLRGSGIKIPTAVNRHTGTVAGLIFFNGTTDFVQPQVFSAAAAGTTLVLSATPCRFAANFVRS